MKATSDLVMRENQEAIMTQLQLEAHERECSMFRELVHGKLDALDKRMWRLEAMIMLSTASMIGIAVVLMTRM